METLNLKLTGIAPLLINNGDMAHPLNQYTIALGKYTSKRKKVEADHEEIARLEFLGGLYWNQGEEPCLPPRMFRGMIIGKGSASRRQKLGKLAELGIRFCKNSKLTFDGPTNPMEMWEDGRFRFDTIEKNPSTGARIPKTRCIIPEWSVDIEFEVNTDFIDLETVLHFFNVAGSEIGLGDRRPVYGRFTVERK